MLVGSMEPPLRLTPLSIISPDDAGKALCTYLMQHVGPAPSDAPPGSAEEAAAAPVEATDTNV